MSGPREAIAIHGHDIIDLVSLYPDGIRLSQLMEVVDERFGKFVTFHTGSTMGMDLDALLRFLEQCRLPVESRRSNCLFQPALRKPSSA